MKTTSWLLVVWSIVPLTILGILVHMWISHRREGTADTEGTPE